MSIPTVRFFFRLWKFLVFLGLRCGDRRCDPKWAWRLAGIITDLPGAPGGTR